MLLIFVSFTLLIVVSTLLPLSRHPHWVIRGMDFPRLQITILAALLLLLLIMMLDTQAAASQALIFITSLCLFWQVKWILPYTVLWPKEVDTASVGDAEQRLSILISNVFKPNRSAGLLIDLVKQHQPDLLVTLESDQWWEDQLKVLEVDMPFSVKCPLDNLYGMHVFSKLPLDEEEVCYLVEQDVPSIHASLSLRSGEKVRVHFLHPAPPSPTENTRSSERDAELVIVAKSVAESQQAVIVMGDLNDVAWSATTRLFRKISGLFDPRVGRGLYNTFHAKYFFLRWPLDHLFLSKHFTLQSIERLPPIGSDHFALLSRLWFTPFSVNKSSGLDATDGDESWGKEISEQQGVDERDVPRPNE